MFVLKTYMSRYSTLTSSRASYPGFKPELGVCVLLLQDLLQSCARGGRRRVEDMCYERRRAEACVDESAHHAGTREEPGTLIQGAPVFPGSSR